MAGVRAPGSGRDRSLRREPRDGAAGDGGGLRSRRPDKEAPAKAAAAADRKPHGEAADGGARKAKLPGLAPRADRLGKAGEKPPNSSGSRRDAARDGASRLF